MALAHTHSSVPSVRAYARPSWLTRLRDRVQGWRAQRETLRLLSSLDRGTLRDLGISPRDLDSVVYGRQDERRAYDRDWWRR